MKPTVSAVIWRPTVNVTDVTGFTSQLLMVKAEGLLTIAGPFWSLKNDNFIGI